MTIGLRVSGHEAAEVYSPEEHKHAETNATCEIHEGYCARHTKIRDQNPSLGMICPGEPHQRSPNAPKFEDRSQERQSGKSKVPVKQPGSWPKNILKLKEKHKTNILLTFGK